MKFTAKRDEFFKVLNHVTGIVERRTTIPILSNVLLSADGDGLSVKATDLDIQIIESIDAAVDVGGSITVPAATLHDILKRLPSGAQVAVNMTNARAHVSSGEARYQIVTLPVEDFPHMESAIKSTIFDVPAADMRTLIDKTKIAISTEETRFYLNGIYLHAPDGANRLRAVTTNGHVLMRADVALPNGAAGIPGVIVPRKTCLELRRLLEDQSGYVTVRLTDTKIGFEFGNIFLTSKLIDGTFPDYNRVIPTRGANRMGVERAALTTAIDRVAFVGGNRSAIAFDLANGELAVECKHPEHGEARDALPVTHEGQALKVGFNPAYMRNVLTSLDGDTAEFYFSDAGTPALINGVGNEDVLAVLMPMRI